MKTEMGSNEVLETLISMTKKSYGDWIVSDLRLGLGNSAAVVKKGSRTSAGLAATQLGTIDIHGGCSYVNRAGTFTGKSVSVVLDGLDISQQLHRTIVLTIANACYTSSLEMQGLDGVDKTGSIPIKGQKVGMVGFFGPMIPKIKKLAASFGVIDLFRERTTEAGGEEFMIENYGELSGFDTVILTATTLINGTFDEVLSSCGDSFVVLMGPSTPLVPALYEKKYPSIRMISGRVVTDTDRTLAVISQAGGTMLLKDCTRKVEIRL